MSDTSAKGKNASELFPGLVKNRQEKKQVKPAPPQEQVTSNELAPVVSTAGNQLPTPPPPPDISWLKKGHFKEKAQISTTPTALILAKDEKTTGLITTALSEFDYQTECATTAKEAIDRTKHLSPAVIILHTGIPDKTEVSNFHRYMCDLQMNKRRSIIYILIDTKLRTLYNLHALSHSANLVINDSDLEHLSVILRKGIQEHKMLFDPFTEALQHCAT